MDTKPADTEALTYTTYDVVVNFTETVASFHERDEARARTRFRRFRRDGVEHVELLKVTTAILACRNVDK